MAYAHLLSSSGPLTPSPRSSLAAVVVLLLGLLPWPSSSSSPSSPSIGRRRPTSSSSSTASPSSPSLPPPSAASTAAPQRPWPRGPPPAWRRGRARRGGRTPGPSPDAARVWAEGARVAGKSSTRSATQDVVSRGLDNHIHCSSTQHVLTATSRRERHAASLNSRALEHKKLSACRSCCMRRAPSGSPATPKLHPRSAGDTRMAQ